MAATPKTHIACSVLLAASGPELRPRVASECTGLRRTLCQEGPPGLAWSTPAGEFHHRYLNTALGVLEERITNKPTGGSRFRQDPPSLRPGFLAVGGSHLTAAGLAGTPPRQPGCRSDTDPAVTQVALLGAGPPSHPRLRSSSHMSIEPMLVCTESIL